MPPVASQHIYNCTEHRWHRKFSFDPFHEWISSLLGEIKLDDAFTRITRALVCKDAAAAAVTRELNGTRATSVKNNWNAGSGTRISDVVIDAKNGEPYLQRVARSRVNSFEE